MSKKYSVSLKNSCVALASVLASSTLLAQNNLAQDNNVASDAERGKAAFYEEVTILGDQQSARQVTGSAHFVGPEQLELFSYSDIQRISRQVPGVSIQVEDGYGLRPNISIRGVATERSSRITLLEDNVLIAPAPYSAPSAYYFPTAGRMHAIEVVKGPAAITQGPYTIGGALNMISTPIPSDLRGNLLMEGGNDSTWRLHGTYGGYQENGFGFLLETHQWQSDGYQNIDRSGNDTGLDLEDYTVKLAYAPQGSAHSIELKLQRTEQNSNQSYLGLTDADFQADAFRRYGLSELDNIHTEHEQLILRYEYQFNSVTSFTATAYRNEHARQWFKTEGIDLDGSADADSLSRTSWSAIINDINLGNSRDGFSATQLHSILAGSLDTATGSIDVRANNREYYSQGLQFGLNTELNTGRANHQLEMGLRFHEDEEDRLQYDSSYQQVSGALILNDIGELGAAGNRIQYAEALAFHLYDRISYGDWVFTPGFRYEDIDQSRTRFNDGALRTVRDGRQNDVEVFLPGLGVAYSLSDQLTLIAGVHKGFTAPTNSPGVKEEEALNTEFGFRFDNGSVKTELIGFTSDYENLLGVCTASSGVDCVIGDAFNGEAATVQGLEFLLTANLSNSSSFSLPFAFTYTYIDGEFDTDIADTAFFGDVSAGDSIPYIPENQWYLSLGLEKGLWGLNVSANYVDEVCVVAACGSFQKTDDSLTLDVSADYQFNDSMIIYSRIENLTGEEDIMGRQPYGARPNKDQTATLGIRVTF